MVAQTLGVPASWCAVKRIASTPAQVRIGGTIAAQRSDRRPTAASRNRFRPRVRRPDRVPWTRPANRAWSIPCSRLANTAQPPIARKAKATWVTLDRAKLAKVGFKPAGSGRGGA